MKAVWHAAHEIAFCNEGQNVSEIFGVLIVTKDAQSARS